MSKSINIYVLSLLVICFLVSIILSGCQSKKENLEAEKLKEYVTKDVSEFKENDLKELEGVIEVYCAKPLEWFMIEDGDAKYCFVITDNTKILNSKGKKQTHQMFNVGTNDLVSVKTSSMCGSLNEEYNDVDAWFICDTVKVLDTIEY